MFENLFTCTMLVDGSLIFAERPPIQKTERRMAASCLYIAAAARWRRRFTCFNDHRLSKVTEVLHANIKGAKHGSYRSPCLYRL